MFRALLLFFLPPTASAFAQLAEFVFEGGFESCAYVLTAEGKDIYRWSGFESRLDGALRSRLAEGTLSEPQTVVQVLNGTIPPLPPHEQHQSLRAEVDASAKSFALYFPLKAKPGATQLSEPVLVGKTSELFFDDGEWERYQAGAPVEAVLSSVDFNLDFLFAATLSSSHVSVNGMQFDFRHLYQFEPGGRFSLVPPIGVPEGFRVVPKEGEFEGVVVKLQRGKEMRLELKPVRARVSYENPAFAAARRKDNYRTTPFALHVDHPNGLLGKLVEVASWTEAEIKQFLLFLRFHEANIFVENKGSRSGTAFSLYRHRRGAGVSADWFVSDVGVKNSSYRWVVEFASIGAIEVRDIDDGLAKLAADTGTRLQERLASQFQVGDTFDTAKLSAPQRVAMFEALKARKIEVEVTYRKETLLLGEPTFEGTVRNVDAGAEIVSFAVEDGWGSALPAVEVRTFADVLQVRVLRVP